MVTKMEYKIIKYLEFFKEKFGTTKELFRLVMFALALNIYNLSNFSLTIDDELSAVRIFPDIWLAQGRWTNFLLEKYLFPQPTLPYLPNLIFSLAMSAAYMLILRAHKLQSSWKTYLAFPIYFSHPIWSFITEFYANVPGLSLGIILVAIAVFIFSLSPQETTPIEPGIGFWFFTPIVLLAAAIGAYEPFFVLYITMGAGVLFSKQLLEQVNGEKIQGVIKGLFQLGVVSGAGYLVSSSIRSILQHLLMVESIYTERFWNLNALIEKPVAIILMVAKEMFYHYSGDGARYGTPIPALIIVVVFGVFTCLIYAFNRSMKVGLWALIMCPAILVFPFLINFVTGGYLQTRGMLAIPYVIWAVVLAILNIKRPLLTFVSVLLIIVLTLQIMTTNAVYNASSFVMQEYDRTLASDLYQRIVFSEGDFNINIPMQVDFYGKLGSIHTPYHPSPSSATMGASFFNWNDGSSYRIISFMKLMGYGNLQIPESRVRIALTPYFEAMPVWPADGSVQKVDDIILIKLGEKPDPVHARYKDK
jgi:hypothetical protein